MNLFFTNYPHYVSLKNYYSAIDKVIGRLSKFQSVISIYQIGTICTPGISDIDLLIVFENNTMCSINPLKGLTRKETYIFSHSLYGITKKAFQESFNYSLFKNYELLWGDELSLRSNDLLHENTIAIRKQIALEYLIKMYIETVVRKTYGVFSVIGLLRHIYGLKYDMEFLDITSGNFFDLIDLLVHWRNKWFDHQQNVKTLGDWVNDFYFELTDFLNTYLQYNTFYLPKRTEFRISRNIQLLPSERVTYEHRGFTLPAQYGWLGKKYFNIQHRFNKFKFYIPIILNETPDILEKRFEFLKKLKRHNSINLPHFMPLTSSLNIF